MAKFFASLLFVVFMFVSSTCLAPAGIVFVHDDLIGPGAPVAATGTLSGVAVVNGRVVATAREELDDGTRISGVSVYAFADEWEARGLVRVRCISASRREDNIIISACACGILLLPAFLLFPLKH